MQVQASHFQGIQNLYYDQESVPRCCRRKISQSVKWLGYTLDYWRIILVSAAHIGNKLPLSPSRFYRPAVVSA